MGHPQPSPVLPGDPEQCRLLGDALHARGRLDDALRAYLQSMSLRPDDLNTLNNAANLLRRMGRFAEALQCYNRALGLAPDHAVVLCNRALALRDLGRIPDAMADLRRAVELQPVFPEAWCNLGEAWRDVRNNNEALHCFRRAIEQKPDFAVAHNNLGVLLRDLGQLEAAQASSRRALALRPGYLNAHSNLLLTGHYLPHACAMDLLQEARAYGETVLRTAQPFTSWPNARDPQRRLRIGLVSGDLRRHPVGFFLDSVLAALKEQDDLDIVAYATRPGDEEMTPRLAASCLAWHSATGWPDARLAEQVRADGIDILIDLAGHTAHNRLAMFASKPAPVQLSWLGYFGTTGVAAMDYLLADPWSLPPQFEAHFTERIRRLPETRLCFSVPEDAPEVSTLPALRNGRVTFGCFGNLSKMNDDVLALWAEVMQAMPGSRLLLKAKQLDDVAMRSDVLARMARCGIGENRVALESYAARRDYLASYAKVDIVLDTFPFPGGTTSAEALWMGVPVLTMKGDSFVACQGVGIMANTGLAHWIAQDRADYVRLAQKHASNLPALAAQRQLMRRQLLASPLFDAGRFARHFEAALRAMWQEWCGS
ncbi:MAG TPA: tetratricopeptide repeat protein [Burkholderiaceae bacterium]